MAPSLNILTLQVPIVININFLQTISINSQEIRLWELINDHQRENTLIYYQILSTYSLRKSPNDHQRENTLIYYQSLSNYSLRKSIETSLENLYVDIGASRVKADFVKNTCRHFTHSIPVSQDEKWGRGTESNFIQITIFCSAKPRVDAFVTALFKNTWILKLKKPAAVLLFSLLSIISADLLGNRILLWRVQKVTVCDLWLANFDPFSVFLCFKVRCLWSWW